MKAIVLLCSILIVLATSKDVVVKDDEPRLSDVSILLPFGTDVVYNLEAFNGCFKWKVMRDSVVDIDVLDSCGLKVSLRNAWRTPTSERISTWITAEDSISGRILRCEIFIDHIARLEIGTTTRTMYQDEIVPLELQGFDKEDNLFSTLEGLIFEWSIKPEKLEVASTVLKIIPFKDAVFDVNPIILEIEKSGKKSSIILVKGEDTGRVTVGAQLVDSDKAHRVSETKVLISVWEPLHLTPSEDIYIAIGTRVQYILHKLSNERFIEIQMPHPQYKWSVQKTDIVEIDENGLLVGKALGFTKIQVQYLNMDDNIAIGYVHVVQPAYLGLEIFLSQEMHELNKVSLNHWALIENNNYNLTVQVYDNDNHKLYTTEDLYFTVTLGAGYFSLNSYTRNRANSEILTTKLGKSEIFAVLDNPRVVPRAISFKQEVTIVSQIEIIPPNLLMPWHPTIYHTYDMKFVGGTGRCAWQSSDTTIVPVNAIGRVSGERLGFSVVTCHDTKNPSNRDESIVTVARPHTISFLPGHVETEVGTDLTLFVQLYDEQGNSFDICDKFPIKFSLNMERASFAIINSNEPIGEGKQACGAVKIHAMNEGVQTLTASFRHETLGEVQTEVKVIAYHPIKISPETVVVALASTAYVKIEGGPIPWLSRPNLHYEDITAETPGHITIARETASTLESNRIYSLTCLKYGEQDLKYVIGNKHPGKGAHIPVQLESNIRFICTAPATLFIYPSTFHHPNMPINAPNSCVESMATLVDTISEGVALDSLPSSYRIRNNREVYFNISVFDHDGRKFTAFSSLDIKWKSSSNDLISIIERKGTGFSRMLKISSLVGDASIRLDIKGIKSSFISSTGASRVWFSPFYKNFEFSLYNPIKMEAPLITIYPHPSNRIRLTTDGGSGNTEVSTNSTTSINVDVAQVGEIYIVPKQTGVTRVTIIDVCVPTDESSSTVFVSDLHSIHLESRDMVEVNSELDIDVVLKDAHGHPFTTDQASLIDWEPRVDKFRILSITSAAQQHKKIPKITVLGQSLGSATITVTARTATGTFVNSPASQIHVYPPLKLHPSPTLYLLPGASYHVQYTGGPPVRSEIAYQVDSNKIASVGTRDGLVQAKVIGNTRLTAKVFSYSIFNSVKSEIGHDSTDVVVKYLDGIRIHSTTNRMYVGEEMVIQVKGINGEEPTIWGNMDIHFRWDNTNPEVASLQPFHVGAVSLDEEGHYLVRLLANTPGKSTVSVKVSEAPNRALMKGMTASFSIICVEPLRLLVPNEILLPPDSQFQIKTTHDSDPVERLQYSIIQREETCGTTQHTVDVNRNGLITALTSGTAFILVENPSGTQSVVLKVIVKPVHHAELRPKTPVHFFLPVGSEQSYDIILRDEMAKEFHSYDSISFSTTESILNIISLSIAPSNETQSQVLTISGLSPGKTQLRLDAISSNIASTFIPIHVTNAILPAQAVVSAGSTLNFITTFKKKTDQSLYKKIWFSSNPEVVEIDAETGRAVAVAPGVAIVSHNGSVSTYTPVNVIKPSELVFDTPKVKYEQSDKPIYQLPIILKNYEKKSISLSPYIDHNIELKCSVEQKYERYFSTSSRISTDGNELFCIVNPSVSLSDRDMPKSITIFATASSAAFNLRGKDEITFSPMFSIEKTSKHIYLSNANREEILKIQFQGEDIQYQCDDPRIIVRPASSNPSYKLFQISVRELGTPFYDSFITFFNPLSGQTEQVLVSYHPTDQKIDEGAEPIPSGDSFFSIWVWACTIAGFGILSVWFVTNRDQKIPPSTRVIDTRMSPTTPPGYPETPNRFSTNNTPYATPAAPYGTPSGGFGSPTFGSPTRGQYTRPVYSTPYHDRPSSPYN
eukprot:TRINITY_DN711_c5_g1_i1.p1 TRINITY_DN711_c5_g1~~TRINITY_DN711_c5_g1_i1.p1  ORF type:complete len:1846 (-),score=382.32 TRINITY_DN711_c5_g1_i1:78-5615(-)